MTNTTKKAMMKTLIVGLTVMLLAGVASAATLVLNPGPGYPTYLGVSCGGVALNEGAVGIDDAGNLVTHVHAYTSCSTGGRGTHPRRYVACWEVVFTPEGTILSRTKYASGTWLQGQPAHDCDWGVDVTEEFVNADTGGVLRTQLIGSTYRATYETP